MDCSFRDGFQSCLGARVKTDDFLPALDAAVKAGIDYIEIGGGARFQSLYFYCQEDAFEMMDRCREVVGPNVNLQTLSRGVNVVGLSSQSSDIIELHAKLFKKHGITTIRNFDALNDVRNLTASGKYITQYGLKHQATVTMPLATIGVFCLWLGWFGFNGGSVLSAEPTKVSFVLVTTMFGAAAGVIGALVSSHVLLRKPDHSMTLNGCLAGLVAITAGADCVSPTSAIIIGLIGGLIVVPSVLIFDKLQLDDPVGALSVHLVNGIWGTLAVGIFAFPETGYNFLSQLTGVAAAAAAAFPAALLIFYVIKKSIGLRVSEDEELRGLDIGEHGMEAYAGFQFFSNQ